MCKLVYVNRLLEGIHSLDFSSDFVFFEFIVRNIFVFIITQLFSAIS
jgi:hypothetical protein